MSKGTYALFNELPIKTLFNRNGIETKKRSTRTAEYVGYPACGWFYYGQNELCVVERYSRLDVNYFK